MTGRERLIEIVDNYEFDCTRCNLCDRPDSDCAKCGSEVLTDYLLENGVIVPPCKTVWYIVDKNTELECVMSANIEDLQLYVVKNLGKYEYYECKEEAERALKERGKE